MKQEGQVYEKKVLTAGLLATMLALNVTACGNKTAPKEVQTAAESDSETNGTDGTATTEETKDAESQETEAETVAQNIPDESRYELQSREPASNAVNTITVTKMANQRLLRSRITLMNWASMEKQLIFVSTSAPAQLKH